MNNNNLISAIDFLRSEGIIFSRAELARAMGIDPGNLSRRIQAPSEKFLARFNMAFDNLFSLQWLVSGEGDMLVPSHEELLQRIRQHYDDEFAPQRHKKSINIENCTNKVVINARRAYEYLRYSGKVGSQKELADIMGITPANVSKYLSGIPTKGFLRRLNDAFGNIFSERWLFYDDGPMLSSDAPASFIPADDEMPRSNEKLRRLINNEMKGDIGAFAQSVGVPSAKIHEYLSRDAEGNYKVLSRTLIRQVSSVYGLRWLGDTFKSSDTLDSENTGSRVAEFFRVRGYTKSAFCEYTGIDQKYLNDVISGASRVDLNLIYRLEELGISIRWLISGEGPMMISDVIRSGSSEQTKPRISFSANAGNLSVESPAELLLRGEQVPVVSNWPEYDFTIVISGDSMSPEFKSGDELGCRFVQDSQVIRWGRPHVLATRDGVVVKRVYDAGKFFRCVSYNSEEYPEYLIDKNNVFQIALVVGVMRCWD